MIDNLHMWLSFLVIVVAMILYIGEWLAIEIVSLLIIIALVTIFTILPYPGLTITQLLAGFGNPALITVIALLVLGQGLFQSGALERVITAISHHANDYPMLTVIITLCMVAALSAFLNNTPIVLMFLPIIAVLARRNAQNNNLYMIGLSYFAILGGMVTLIGSSTNLLVADAAARAANIKIGFFDQSIVGLVLALSGGIFLFLVMPRLMRSNTQSAPAQGNEYSGQQFVLEVRLRSNSPLIGMHATAGIFPNLTGVTLQMIDSIDGTILPPFDDYALATGDRLFIATTRRQLDTIMTARNHPLHEHINRLSAQLIEKDNTLLAELVVAPGSRMIGRAIHQTDFTHDTDCLIIGVQRRTRMARHALADMRLEAGDVLLVIGAQSRIENLRGSRDTLLMEWSTRELPNFAHAIRARWIFAFTIAAAAFGIVPIVLAALMGATTMIITRVLNIRQAVRAIDMRIFLLIGAALAMASALSATQGAQYLSTQFLLLFADSSPTIILAGFFLLCALITNVLSNTATAVLFTPIAINLARSLDAPPEAFIFAVIFAANCSFVTPIAYQTNLMVMTAGNLNFRDFARAGIPLLLVIWLTYIFVAPFYFGL